MINVDMKKGSILKVLLGGAGFVIILFGIKASADILNPILLAVIIGITVIPLADWLESRGAPRWLAFSLTIAAILLSLVGLIALITISVNNLIVSLPLYQENAQRLLTSLQAGLNNIGFDQSQIRSSLAQINTASIFNFISHLLGSILDSVSKLIIMLLVLFFFILGAPMMSALFNRNFPEDSSEINRYRQLALHLRKYIVVSSGFSFLVGMLDAILLLLLGVDFAILWGILGFLMGYIPGIGFWIAVIPPFLLALLQYGIGKALIVLVGYSLITGLGQSILRPKMIGTGLNLSPFAVMVSLFLWGWIMGPVGILLAVPMTLIIREILLDAYPETRKFSILMGADVSKELPDIPEDS